MLIEIKVPDEQIDAIAQALNYPETIFTEDIGSSPNPQSKPDFIREYLINSLIGPVAELAVAQSQAQAKAVAVKELQNVIN